MIRELYHLLYTFETKDCIKTTTIHLNIPDFEWLLENQTNREIRTRENDFVDPIDEDSKFQLRIRFIGSENNLIEIYYLAPVAVYMKAVLHRWMMIRDGYIHNGYVTEVTLKDDYVQANSWHLFKAITKQNILNSINKDGVCLLRCIFSVKTSNSILKETVSADVPGPLINDEDEESKTEPQLINDLKKMFNSSLFSDVTIKSAEGVVEFQAHKAILAARSEVLEAHFEHDTVESLTNVVETPIEAKVLEQMLNYIYTDKVQNINEIERELLIAADFYQMGGLKKLCEEALSKKLTVVNAIETLQLAELHNAHNLKKKSLKFIHNGLAKEITRTEGWKNLQSVELVKCLYENNITI